MTGEVPTPPRVRRMLPSVSEVLKELTSRAPVEPDVAFRAAREVCAEELKRIRDAGGDSVPLEELVQRALVRVGGGRPPAPSPPSLAAAPPAPAPAPEPAPAEVVPVFDDAPAPLFEPAGAAVEEPFSETTGAMDLRWDPEPHEPFSEAGAGTPFSPADAGRQAAAPGPGAFPPPEATDAPVPFVLPAEEEPFVLPAPSPDEPTAFLPPEPEEGPGDETLTRLSREAESIDLQSVFPRSPEAEPGPPEPRAFEAEGTPGTGQEEAPPPFEDDEDTVLTVPRGGRRRGRRAGPRLGLLLGVAASLAALAGLGYLLVGLWMERDAAPAPVAVARPRPTATPGSVLPAGETRGEAVGAEAPSATPPPVVAAPEPAALPAPAPRAASDVAPPAAPGASPAPVPTRPALVPPEPSPVESVPTPPARAAAVPRSRDGLVVTADRAGQPQVFSIHFTSYRDRSSAERDLKRIEGIVGRDGYVAEVDLGEKGIWQRVMIGAFPTAQEARAVREELAAKGTRDMGWVYRVVGPEGPFAP